MTATSLKIAVTKRMAANAAAKLIFRETLATIAFRILFQPDLKEEHMKAIRVSDFGAPDVLKLQDVPDPKPDSGQVLVRVKAAGVNPVDTYIRAGAYARKPNLPYTPGTDAGGIVEAVGANVKHFKVGDRVYTNGSITGVYAELALCEELRVHLLPSKVS